MAMKDWVRVKANMNLGAYEIFKAVERHQRAGLAATGVLGADQDRFPRPSGRSHRPSGHQATAWAGVTWRSRRPNEEAVGRSPS